MAPENWPIEWKKWLKEADQAKENRAKASQVREGFRSESTLFPDDVYYLWELKNSSYLAKAQIKWIEDAGQRAVSGLMLKEAAESVHRCLKLAREPIDCQDALRHPQIQKMRKFLMRAAHSQALLCEFDDAVVTANLFLEVRSEEVRVEEIQVLMIRGIARFYQGLPASVKDFDTAVALANSLKHKELEAHAWFAKGYALYFVDPIDYADSYFECFQKCLEILEATNDIARADSVRNVVIAIRKRYIVNWSPRHEQEGLDSEAEILRLMEAEENQSREEGGYPGELASTKQGLGYWLFHKDMFIEAEKKFRDSVELWTKANRMKKDSMYQVTAALSITTAYNQLQACLVKQGKPLEALMWSERARARALRNRLGHEDEDGLFEEDDNKAIEKIKTVLDGYAGAVVAVEYSFVSTNLLIWVLKPKSLPTVKQISLDTMDFPNIGPVRVEKGQATSLTIMEMVDLLIQQLSGSNSDRRSRKYLEFFYELLIKPIEDELIGCDTIVFIPVQALNRLPWGALCKPKGQYLAQQYAFVCAQSLYLLGFCSLQWEKKRTTKCTHGDDILLVSNPRPLSRPKLSDLKFAETETKEIRELLKIHTGLVPAEYKGEEATRAKVMEKLPKAKWVHIASHNVCNTFYSAGALMLSAPKAEAYNWDHPPDVDQLQVGTLDIESGSHRILRTRTNYGSLVGQDMDGAASQDETDRGVLSAMQLTNIPTEACGVVLSACSTGKGELIGDEGILGFVRALHVALTPAVMVSLWDISDKHTSTLMKHLYQNLLEGDPETGLPSPNWALALKRARESMIGSSPEVEVGHWAAFQIYGTPDVTFPVSKLSNCNRPEVDCNRPEVGWSKPKNHVVIASLVFAVLAVLWAIILGY